MPIDMSQFHQAFFEESLDGLNAMENGLLALSQGAEDPDLIHSVFRAAHSIKGGSGTFGFADISACAHRVEQLLDSLRDGRRAPDKPVIDLLLESVDVLRGLLAEAQGEAEADPARVASLNERLEACLGGEAPAPASPPVAAAPGKTEAATQAATESHGQGWRIRFDPHPGIMQRGNDPLRILRALADMGRLRSQARLDRVPPLDRLDPESLYLGWDLELEGEVERAALEDLFDWVVEDCDLDIQPLQASAAPAAAAPEPAASVQAPAAPATARPMKSTPVAPRPAEAASIRVSTEKVDALIDIVGELIITQSMLGQIGASDEPLDAGALERLRGGLEALERNTRELQESVLGIRMLPIAFAFNRFPRLVHDLCGKFGKQVRLDIQGEQTELDKTVLERIGDPLVHLVRNAMDHGIETPDVRRRAGKPEEATLTLAASHQGGQIVIEIRDDGAGLDRERILARARERGLVEAQARPTATEIDELIFEPGFSTAETVSDVSGRGVAMDVVRRNILELGGTIEIESAPGQGTAFIIRLPLTLAIMDAQLVQLGHESYAIPLVAIVESLQLEPSSVREVAGHKRIYRLRDEYLPILNLHDYFGVSERIAEHADRVLVVIESHGARVALVVDELLGQQQVVIKSLEANFRRVAGLAGATILGDGSVALIVDPGDLVRAVARPPSGMSSVA